MSHQITKVDLIPNGELSVCNVSQFDNGRVLPFEILENKEAYNIPNDIRVELHCRKPDGNIVTLPSESIADNIVTFLSTTQLTACYGKNVCEIALYGPDDYLIGSCNFILEVEKSPTLGGINSTTAIHNLESQVEEITTEVIGDNYYNKTEVDDLLDAKADKSDTYTKTQVDTLLTAKADKSNTYTKAETNTLLDAKANAADVYTKSQVDTALALKANAADVYTKAETDAKIEEAIEDILPVDTAGPSAIASFTTGLALPFVDCEVGITATGGNGTPDNPNPIVGYTEANITRCGVNLWDEEWELGTINNNTGALVPNSSIIRSKNFIPVRGGVTILIYATSTSNMWIRVFEYDKNENYIVSDAKYTGTTYQLNANTAYIKFYVKSDYGTTYNNDISILYPSDTTPAYHAYNGQTYTIAFGQTVYGGVLDVTRGKLHVTHYGVEYDGTEDGWSWYGDYQQASIALPYPAKYEIDNITYKCNRLTPVLNQSRPQNVGNYASLVSSGANGAFSTPETSLANFKTWLGSNHVQFVYELATPFDIDLTPEVLSAIVGTNNVSSNTGPVTVRFKTTIEDYINSRINRANTNRSLLSSVNSDIIKEKSEIKEQSDIIEDNERGEENE